MAFDVMALGTSRIHLVQQDGSPPPMSAWKERKLVSGLLSKSTP